jgi:NhaA family Na+:H+ antiporter
LQTFSRMLKKAGFFLTSPEKLSGKIVRPFRSFFMKEASSSILLLTITSIAFLWANSPFASTYHNFWESRISISIGDFIISKNIRHWIDEGLMSIFFFTVGLEIKREVLVGELATLRRAVLPAAAAAGGMLVPALIYAALNHGTVTSAGWGIPMATDIAFALGILYIFGKRVPIGLRVFLSALAIIDDIGAAMVIAVFYKQQIVISYVLIALLIVAILALANFFWVRRPLIYAVLGIALWLAVLASGLHATMAGIIVAMFIPARGRYGTDIFIGEVHNYLKNFDCSPDGCGDSIMLNQKHLNSVQSIEMACHDVETPLQRLEHALTPWVAFLVVPLFGLANAGFSLGDVDLVQAMTSRLTLGITAGLLLGKPVGIILFTYIFLKMKIVTLSSGVTWGHLISAGFLGGVGFTMSFFIAGLSFQDKLFHDYSKLGILSGSILSGAIGTYLLYRSTLQKNTG